MAARAIRVSFLPLFAYFSFLLLVLKFFFSRRFLYAIKSFWLDTQTLPISIIAIDYFLIQFNVIQYLRKKSNYKFLKRTLILLYSQFMYIFFNYVTVNYLLLLCVRGTWRRGRLSLSISSYAWFLLATFLILSSFPRPGPPSSHTCASCRGPLSSILLPSICIVRIKFSKPSFLIIYPINFSCIFSGLKYFCYHFSKSSMLFIRSDNRIVRILL